MSDLFPLMSCLPFISPSHLPRSSFNQAIKSLVFWFPSPFDMLAYMDAYTSSRDYLDICGVLQKHYVALERAPPLTVLDEVGKSIRLSGTNQVVIQFTTDLDLHHEDELEQAIRSVQTTRDAIADRLRMLWNEYLCLLMESERKEMVTGVVSQRALDMWRAERLRHLKYGQLNGMEIHSIVVREDKRSAKFLDVLCTPPNPVCTSMVLSKRKREIEDNQFCSTDGLELLIMSCLELETEGRGEVGVEQPVKKRLRGVNDTPLVC